MSSNKVQQLEALALSFPSLRRCLPAQLFNPWDAVRFAEYFAPMSSGEKEAALFVLSVWSWMDDWSEFGLVCASEGEANRGRFDVHRALSRWDEEHVRAFRRVGGSAVVVLDQGSANTLLTMCHFGA